MPSQDLPTRIANLETATFVQPLTIPGASKNILTPYTGATDAIAYPGVALINTAGVDACTLATPVAGLDDGKLLKIVAGSANAHTVTTAAHKIIDGSSTSKDTITFAGNNGGSIELMAYNGLWYVISTPLNATLSEV